MNNKFPALIVANNSPLMLISLLNLVVCWTKLRQCQGNHQTVEDCYVCCRPIEFMIESDGQTLNRIDTFTDDESIIWLF